MADLLRVNEDTRGRSQFPRHLMVRLEGLLRQRQRELLLELRDRSLGPASSGATAADAEDTLRYFFEAAKRRLETDTAAVSAALTRIGTDQYGICTSCSEPIDHRRLVMIPETELCTTCQWRAESAGLHRSAAARTR